MPSDHAATSIPGAGNQLAHRGDRERGQSRPIRPTSRTQQLCSPFGRSSQCWRTASLKLEETNLKPFRERDDLQWGQARTSTFKLASVSSFIIFETTAILGKVNNALRFLNTTNTTECILWCSETVRRFKIQVWQYIGNCWSWVISKADPLRYSTWECVWHFPTKKKKDFFQSIYIQNYTDFNFGNIWNLTCA